MTKKLGWALHGSVGPGRVRLGAAGRCRVGSGLVRAPMERQLFNFNFFQRVGMAR